MMIIVSLQDVADLATQYRYVIGTEAEFQDGFARVLQQHGIEHAREYDLGAGFGRIDFFLTASGIGIELKVKGSPSDVMRQLHRYAMCPRIHALVLVTVRSRLTFTPRQINRKPLLTAAVWQTQI
jgi:hypothetical protein